MLQRNKVVMPGLGTFHLKHWKLEKRMAEVRKSIKSTQNYGLNEKKWKICENYRAEFRRLAAVFKVFKKDLKEREEIRKKQNEMREEYYPDYLKKLKASGVDEKTIIYLEEQAQNRRGNTKLVVSETLRGENCGKEVSDL